MGRVEITPTALIHFFCVQSPKRIVGEGEAAYKWLKGEWDIAEMDWDAAQNLWLGFKSWDIIYCSQHMPLGKWEPMTEQKNRPDSLWRQEDSLKWNT